MLFRKKVPTLQQCENLVDQTVTPLRDTLDLDPTSADTEALQTFAAQVKGQWRVYLNASLDLTQRYLTSAATEEAQSSRETRSLMRKEVSEFITLINASLEKINQEEISNIDTRSVILTENGSEAPLDEGDHLNSRNWDAESRLPGETQHSTKQKPITAEASAVQPNHKERVASWVVNPTQSVNAEVSVKPRLPYTSVPFNHGTTPHNGFGNPSPARNQVPFAASPQELSGAAFIHSNESPLTNFMPLQAGNCLPDPSSVYLIKQDLFKPSASPYDGDPHKFRSWTLLLQNRMKGLHLNALDTISVLLANTSSGPHKLVQDHLDSGAAFPEATLEKIWQRLRKKYGSPLMVCSSIQKRLQAFPPLKPPNVTTKLQDLIHLCRMIEANMEVNPELKMFDLTVGQSQIWNKLPDWLQIKWRSHAFKLSKENSAPLPPLSALIDFMEYNLEEMSCLSFETPVTKVIRGTMATVTEPASTDSQNPPVKCLYHDTSGHSLINCRTFGKLSYGDKQKFASEKWLCFKCLGQHLAKNCHNRQHCLKCRRDHSTIMHPETQRNKPRNSPRRTVSTPQEENQHNVLCSVVCGHPEKALSCSKTVLCKIHHESDPSKSLLVYALIDDMSDSSYIAESLVEDLSLPGKEISYLLKTMSSLQSLHRGLSVSGLWITGVSNGKSFALPEVNTSSFIPGSIYEVGTPGIVRTIPHLAHLADKFLEVDRNAQPLILIGRDAGVLMKSNCYGGCAPFACETPLGYALIGSPCPDMAAEKPRTQVVLRTTHEHYHSTKQFPPNPLDHQIFQELEDDDSLAHSRDDLKFLRLVDKSIHVNSRGKITMCLPFKNEDVHMPDNRCAVYHRTVNTLNNLKKNPVKLEACVTAMSKNIKAGHVEVVPNLELKPTKEGKVWWLPIFVVSQPKKNKHRLVFDSSAKYGGTSLNSSLLQGPDENNRLRGVLMRFRNGEVAFAGDIEAMFYNFDLPNNEKDYLRFFWFEDNDPKKKIVQYRGLVHLFGNKSSPAIANAGIRYTTKEPYAQKFPIAVKYILENLYVDDLLGACRSSEKAIELLKQILDILKKYKIRLCKIVSSDPGVTGHLPQEECAVSGERDIGDCSVHRALGLAWQTNDDHLFIKSEIPERALSRRGMLSVTNSIYDPLGIAGPAVLQGRIIQRKALQISGSDTTYDWDDPLPEKFAQGWVSWLQSLSSLCALRLPRSYIPKSFGDVTRYELHTFTDSSECAIGTVIYLRIFNHSDKPHVAYVISSTRLIPKSCTSMPRSELCAALLGSTLLKEARNELKLPIDQYFLYSDSKVVLAYLKNTEKRFSKFVSHRVSAVLKVTEPSWWRYIGTRSNPADIACRPHTPESLASSVWLKGPEFLQQPSDNLFEDTPDLEVDIPEIVPQKSALKSKRCGSNPLELIGARSSTFHKAVGVMAAVMRFCGKILQLRNRSLNAPPNNTNRELATIHLVRSAQQSSYSDIMSSTFKAETGV